MPSRSNSGLHERLRGLEIGLFLLFSDFAALVDCGETTSAALAEAASRDYAGPACICAFSELASWIFYFSCDFYHRLVYYVDIVLSGEDNV